MTEHDGFEHELPNGDILIVDATVSDERIGKLVARTSSSAPRPERSDNRAPESPFAVGEVTA